MSSTDTRPTRRPLTVPMIRGRKVRDGAEPLVMVTAYDAPGARIVDEAGVDLILVGDSLAMVVLGYDDTLQVTIDDMAHHVAAVARAKPSALIVADLPWMSYHVSIEDTVRNAASSSGPAPGGEARGRPQAVADGRGAGRRRDPGDGPPRPHAAVGARHGRVQGAGQGLEAAMALVADAKALAHAGCFAIVLEGVPAEVARMVTDTVDVPTIGIGAGPDCDGQVLVFHDVLGIEDRIAPKFVRRYASLKEDAVAAVAAYADDVRAGRFPGPDESYHLAAEVAETLGLYGSGRDTAS